MYSLLCGDCLEQMKSLSDASVDMVMCDLPYGTTRNKWDSVIPLEPLWKEWLRVCKTDAAIVLTAQPPFDKLLGCSNLKMFRYEWIWEKTSATGFLNAKRQPMKAHENVLVFYSAQCTYNPQKTTGHVRKISSVQHKRGCRKTENYGAHGPYGYDSTERYPRSVIRMASDKQKCALHPTQKPVALMEYLIRTYTNPGETVLDNTMGSGTTGVACMNTGRLFVGIERDELYFAKASERIEAARIAAANQAIQQAA